MNRFRRRDGNLVITFEEAYMTEVEREWTVGSVKIEQNWLYGFFDETGDEKITSNQNLFAYSGIVFVGNLDQEQFEATWSTLRSDLFRIRPENVYHSNRHFKKFRKKGYKLTRVVEALNRFGIHYLSSCIFDSAYIDVERIDKNVRVIEGVLGNLSNMVNEVFHEQVQRDEWYFEDNFRINPVLMGCSGPRYSRSIQNGGIQFIRKQTRNSFMEIADFVSYVVNQQMVSEYQERPSAFDEVFKALFADPSRGRCSVVQGMFGPVITPTKS